MATRTIQQIDAEIQTTFARLNRERILTEALDASENDEERRAVEDIGPSFIDQYFTALNGFTSCACSGGTGFSADLLHEILPSIGIPIQRYVDTEGDRILKHLIARELSTCCYSRQELVRVYCLVKNDPSILERVRQQG